MKEIKHWETRTMKWQERHQKYTSESKYDIVTLEHEALVIFCVETGEHKIIKHKEEIEILEIPPNKAVKEIWNKKK